jgi:hypothetical protein
MANNVLTYTINLNGNVTKGVLDISGAATQAHTKMNKLADAANKIANIGFAFQHAAALVGKFTAAMDKCVKAYEMQAVAEKKLETLMRNSMAATDVQIKNIKDLTAAQQKLGVIGDEIQLAGAQELSTYLTKTESLQKLIPVMNDMLAQQYGLNASQEQAVTIAQMMGKVLDGQVGALSRYGYRFDDAQEAVLKYGNEQQKVTMLSRILTQYVGGVNAALAATPEGKWKQHQNAMGDLRERVGALFVAIRGALLPAFVAVSNIVQRLTAFFEEHKQSIMGVAETVGNILSVAFNTVGSAIMFVVEHWKAFTAAIVAWKVVAVVATMHHAKWWLLLLRHMKILQLCTGATNLFTRATRTLKLAFDTLARHPWLIAITAAIGLTVALVGAFRKFNQAQREAQKAVSSVAAKIGVEQRGLDALFEAMKKTNPESEQRKTLIDKLNAKYPVLLKNQNLLKGSIEDIAKAQNDANEALAKNILLQSYNEMYGQEEKKIFDAQQAFHAKLWEATNGSIQKEAFNAILNTIGDEAKKTATYKYITIQSPTTGTTFSTTQDERLLRVSETAKKYGISADKNWIKELFNVVEIAYSKQKALIDFAGSRFGITYDMLTSYVNNGILTGSGSGGDSPLGNTTEAIATGGKRNTTVNIHLGKMQAAEIIHYNGGIGENIADTSRRLAEEMAKVLGMAETSTAA